MEGSLFTSDRVVRTERWARWRTGAEPGL